MRCYVQNSTSRLLAARCVLAAFALATCLAAPCSAADVAAIAWHNDVTQAWQQAQRAQRPLVVYVTHENCVFCEKMKQQTWRDARVARAVRDGFVPLFVDATHPSLLTKELAVNAYPATFVISPQAVVLDRINGFVPPERLAARLATVRQPPAAQVAGRP